MNFEKLVNVDTVKGPVKDSKLEKKDPIKDALKTSEPLKEMLASDLLNADRVTRRKYLARVSDSERRKVLLEMKKIRDAEESEGKDKEFYSDLSDKLTNFIADLEGKEDLDAYLKSDKLSESEKAVIKWVLSLDPLSSLELAELVKPLKEKFKSLEVSVPPFVLLQDSYQALLSGNKVEDSGDFIFIKNEKSETDKVDDSVKVQDADPIKEVADEPLEDEDESLEDEDESLESIPTEEQFNSLTEDGLVSKEKWTEQGFDSNAFDAMDADSDGQISLEDLKSYTESDVATSDEPVDEEPSDEGTTDEDIESEDTPSFEDYQKVVHAVDEFMKSGDKSVFEGLAVTDSVKRLKDAWDENGNYVLSKEETDKILEDVKKDLEDKGVKIAQDSLQGFNEFKLTFPKVADSMQVSQVPLSNKEFHALNDAMDFRRIMKVGKLFKSDSCIPFSEVKRDGMMISCSSKNMTQTWVTTSNIADSEITPKWVEDNCISSANYAKAAQFLGIASMLDSRFYKKSINDCYETDQMSIEEASQESLIIPASVSEVVKQFPDGCKVKLIFTNTAPAENAVPVETSTAICPLEESSCFVCEC